MLLSNILICPTVDFICSALTDRDHRQCLSWQLFVPSHVHDAKKWCGLKNGGSGKCNLNPCRRFRHVCRESTNLQVQITVRGTQELWTLFSDTVTRCTFINRFVTTSVIPLFAHPDSQIQYDTDTDNKTRSSCVWSQSSIWTIASSSDSPFLLSNWRFFLSHVFFFFLQHTCAVQDIAKLDQSYAHVHSVKWSGQTCLLSACGLQMQM